MEYLKELWEKSGCPTKPTDYNFSDMIVVVDTYKQLTLKPLFNDCIVKRLNVVRTEQNNNRYIYIVEFFAETNKSTPTTFVVSMFDQSDLGYFKNFVIMNEISDFGPKVKVVTTGEKVPGTGTDGLLSKLYSKEDIKRKLNTFLSKNEFSISASTTSKLTTWVNDEF